MSVSENNAQTSSCVDKIQNGSDPVHVTMPSDRGGSGSDGQRAGKALRPPRPPSLKALCLLGQRGAG